MDNNNILKIDIAIIATSLIVVLGLIGYSRPLLISPLNNLETLNNSVLFSFEKGSSILLDDNINFTSPEVINAEKNLIVNLKPGVYYWKIDGLVQSEIRKVTIKSSVDLKLRESGDNYEVINAGNSKLNVSVYNGSVLTGNLILGLGESSNHSATKFIGRENDE